MQTRRAIRARLVTACAVLFVVGMLGAAPCGAASIPAWLDDAISKWNGENPTVPITFVDIKDAWVWYEIPKTSEIGHQRIREAINRITLGKGYEPLNDEEFVTTARPPVKGGPATQKKCWNRSFVLNVQAQGNTKAVGDESPGQRQNMLSSMVCDDADRWWASFRVAQ